MSITIHQAPPSYGSAHEECWHVVESTDKALSGFQYVFDIYKAGNLITRVKNAPYGPNKLGVLDVGNIVRASLDTYNLPDINPNSFTANRTLGADLFFTDYQIRYGQVSGMAEVSGNITSGSYRVYNNYLRSKWDKKQSKINVLSWDFGYGRILTNRPLNNNFYPGEPIVLSMFVDDTSELGAEYSRILYIDDESTSSFDYDTSGFYNTANIFSWVPIGNKNQVDISVDYGGSVNTFQSFKFNKKCSKYETHTLVFLNAYGVYDSFTFVYGKLMMSNEKKKFEQNRWQLVNYSMLENIGTNGAIYNESVKTYAVKYKERMQLTSDILSSGEYNWLSELINSPQVYYYSTENSEFYPVQITDSDYEFKDDRINKTDTLTVNIEFSVNQNTQYR